MPLADLTSKDAVKLFAGVTGTADDALITSMVTAYSAWVRSYLGRDVTSASYDIRRSGRGTFAMLMPQYPITAVAAVTIDGRSIPAQATWGQAGYYFDDDQIALAGFTFTRGISNVRIQFTAGLATPPADLAQACAELVTLRYRLRDKMEWSSKSLAGETVSLVQKDMPASVRTILDQYRLIAPL